MLNLDLTKAQKKIAPLVPQTGGVDELFQFFDSIGAQIVNPKMDGEIHRFDWTTKKSGWYVIHKVRDNFFISVAGDWANGGETWVFKSDSTRLSKTEQRRIDEKIKIAKQKAESERLLMQDNARETAKQLFRQSKTEITGYLKRKKISKNFGTRSKENILVVPCRDIDGKFWGAQKILDNGAKFFEKGQKVKGTFHVLNGNLEDAETIYIAEGFATAASIAEAMDAVVVCAFNASNLVEVGKIISDRIQQTPIVICGDEDKFTEIGNAGRTAALELAKYAQGEAIFPVFKDESTKPTDFNDLFCLEGIEAVREQLKPKAEPIERDYVRALGFNENHFFYTSSFNKYVVALSPSSHTQLNLCSLAPLKYWEGRFPNKKPGPGFIDWSEAASRLMNNCRMAGRFNPKLVRSSGAWKGDHGELILNTSESLLVNGREMDLHKINQRAMYQPGNVKFPAPVKDFCSAEEAKELIEALKMLNWAKKESPLYLAGWIFLAPLCGALDWRPHIWLTGPSGSGKSTIMNELVHNILGEFAVFVQGASSEAGVRQRIKTDAVPLIFDEFETNNKKSAQKVEAMVELFRQASSDTLSSVVRGTPEGNSIDYSIRFMGLNASVNVQLTHEADQNRFVVTELKRTEPSMESVENYQSFLREVQKFKGDFGKRLYSRAFAMWEPIKTNKALFYSNFSKVHGGRAADLYGTLISGLYAMENDVAIEPDAVGDYLSQFALDIHEERTDQDEGDEMACLNHLLDHVLVFAGGERHSVRECLERLVKGIESDTFLNECDRMLKNIGIKFIDEGFPKFAIANSHSQLDKIYDDTKWRKCHKRSLRRIEGHEVPTNAIRIIGKTRATILPISAALSESDF
jgi:putative DNA primase/helicase